jgi:hypothetical protein
VRAGGHRRAPGVTGSSTAPEFPGFTGAPPPSLSGLPTAPMDESKIALPPWLPWATAACLGALAACMGELWIIEKARTQLVRDENLLSQASLKAAQNQLEAERILSARELGQLQAAREGRAALLSEPSAEASEPSGPNAPWGVVTWDPGARHAVIRCSGLPPLGPDRDFQIWVEGPSRDYPISCGHFHALPADGFRLDLQSPVVRGYRILLIDGKKGGDQSLAEARAAGSIVLATAPHPGKISTDDH